MSKKFCQKVMALGVVGWGYSGMWGYSDNLCFKS